MALLAFASARAGEPARALPVTAAAQDTDFARLARSAGTPQIPGLNIVYLSPLGDPRRSAVEEHHPASDRGAGGLGGGAGAPAGRQSEEARRHALGRDRRHGVLGDAGDRCHHPWRRRQPQRQQVHSESHDLPPGGRGELDRRRIRRKLSRRAQSPRPRNNSPRRSFWSVSFRSVTGYRPSACSPTTGSTTRTTAIARAASSPSAPVHRPITAVAPLTNSLRTSAGFPRYVPGACRRTNSCAGRMCFSGDHAVAKLSRIGLLSALLCLMAMGGGRGAGIPGSSRRT